VFVDDADVEYPIDKNDFFQQSTAIKSVLIVCLTLFTALQVNGLMQAYFELLGLPKLLVGTTKPL
jgi:hypothetical protein